MFWNKSINNKVSEYRKALIEEEKQQKRLASKNLDYAYLEQIVKRCENNKDLVIEITLADGTYLKIKTDRNPVRLKSSELFDQIEDL